MTTNVEKIQAAVNETFDVFQKHKLDGAEVMTALQAMTASTLAMNPKSIEKLYTVNLKNDTLARRLARLREAGQPRTVT